MRKTALVPAALLLAIATPASAQSLSRTPASSWSGFYVGANLGGIFGNPNASQAVVSGAGFPLIGAGRTLYGGAGPFGQKDQGIVGGGQAGYNWAMPSNWVFGVETDLQGSGLKGRTDCILICGQRYVTTTPPNILASFPVIFSENSFSDKIDWFGTTRARLGYTSGPTMVYLTGGLAYGEVQRSGRVVGRTTFNGNGTINAFAGSYDHKSTRIGWTLGAGAEAKLSSKWSAKLEYLYVDLGNSTDAFQTIFTQGGGGAVVGTVAATRTDTSHARDHVVRAGVNYALGGP